MKNIWSIFLLCSVFFYNSCSNQPKDQQSTTDQTDTSVLIASNTQNLIPDGQETKINAADQTEIPAKESHSTSAIPKKENVKTPVKEKHSEIDGMIREEGKGGKEEIVGDKGTGDVAIVEEAKVIDPKANEKTVKNETPAKVPFSHDQWDQLLRKYVSASGKVNYKGFKAEKAVLDAYLKYLENNPIQDNWSKAKKMAYWINAYNAFTIKMIVDNYPVSSITKLHGGKPWDVKWIKLNGQTYNLNNIENDILRPKYKDARIHFAVNCAAQSCPPILNEAWTEGNLEQMLEKQSKAFINNPNFNSIKSTEVEISKIFEWYAADFGNIVDYLNQYSTTKINKNAKVKYKEYNWNLNE